MFEYFLKLVEKIPDFKIMYGAFVYKFSKIASEYLYNLQKKQTLKARVHFENSQLKSSLISPQMVHTNMHFWKIYLDSNPTYARIKVFV